jgi:hypothetical protein
LIAELFLGNHEGSPRDCQTPKSIATDLAMINTTMIENLDDQYA